MRVPAIVHWAGRITPGRSLELFSTLDVLPTIAAITGADLPKVTIDGHDLSPTFIGGHPSPRESFFYYSPEASIILNSFAVRHKQYKAVFITQGAHESDDQNRDVACRKSARITKYDPPMLFDLNNDPSENYDLSSKTEYKGLITKITALKAEFDSKMVWAPSEIEKAHHDEYMPCCNPGCKPFPQCCHCSTKSESTGTYSRDKNILYTDL